MKKGFAILPAILIILVVSSVSFGLYKFVSIKSKDLDTIPSEKNSEDETSGWATYTNGVYAYQIKYNSQFGPPPPESMPSPPPPVSFNIQKMWNQGVDAGMPEWCYIEILSFEGADSFEGEIKSLQNDISYKEETSNINGKSAKKFIYDSKGTAVSVSYYVSNGPFSYRIGYNYQKDGTHADWCKQNSEAAIANFKFLTTPNFIEQGNIVTAYEEGFSLLYDTPGNPAAKVLLKFTPSSICNFGKGNESCDLYKFTIGDRVEVFGQKNGDFADITWLSKIFD